MMSRSSLPKNVRVRISAFFFLSDLLITRIMTEQDAIAAMEAMEALEAQNAAKAREEQMAAAMAAADKTAVSDTDTTFTGNHTTMTSNKSSSVVPKKKVKTKLTAKEKKERSVSFFYGWFFLRET